MQHNLTILQYGDFLEAYHRLRNGGEENYKEQKNSVDHTLKISEQRKVHVISIGDSSYFSRINQNLTAAGITIRNAYRKSKMIEALERRKYGTFICRTPHPEALNWAAINGIPTLPLFADTLSSHSPREILNNLKLRKVFRKLKFPAAANHGSHAVESLSRAGVERSKRIRWDWPKPVPMEPVMACRPTTFKLLYVGLLQENKGVGDLIKALASVHKNDRNVTLDIYGKGEIKKFESLSKRLKIQNRIRFKGVVPSKEIVPIMRAHHAVIVPSRKSYREGFPNVITEALTSGVPLIASAHPAYRSELRPYLHALYFRPGSNASLASAVKRLIADTNLYRDLSNAGKKYLPRMKGGVNPLRLIDCFLNDPLGRTDWPQKIQNSHSSESYE